MTFSKTFLYIAKNTEKTFQLQVLCVKSGNFDVVVAESIPSSKTIHVVLRHDKNIMFKIECIFKSSVFFKITWYNSECEHFFNLPYFPHLHLCNFAGSYYSSKYQLTLCIVLFIHFSMHVSEIDNVSVVTNTIQNQYLDIENRIALGTLQIQITQHHQLEIFYLCTCSTSCLFGCILGYMNKQHDHKHLQIMFHCIAN